MNQQIIDKNQPEKEQKSLIWIISTIYLTTILSGGILATIFVFIGGNLLVGFPNAIKIPINWLLWIAGILLGLKMGINYVQKKSAVKKADVLKISLWVATVGIIFYGILTLSRGFSLWDLMIIALSAIIFYMTKYLLEKKSI